MINLYSYPIETAIEGPPSLQPNAKIVMSFKTRKEFLDATNFPPNDWKFRPNSNIFGGYFVDKTTGQTFEPDLN